MRNETLGRRKASLIIDLALEQFDSFGCVADDDLPDRHEQQDGESLSASDSP